MAQALYRSSAAGNGSFGPFVLLVQDSQAASSCLSSSTDCPRSGRTSTSWPSELRPPLEGLVAQPARTRTRSRAIDLRDVMFFLLVPAWPEPQFPDNPARPCVSPPGHGPTSSVLGLDLGRASTTWWPENTRFRN